MKFYLISYATEEYETFQKELHGLEILKEFVHKPYSQNDIDLDFYEKNKNILEKKRGAGYWLWKPYFILKTLNEIDNNDVVVYIDCGDNIYKNPIDYLTEKFKVTDNVFLMGHHNHETWCKRVCFDLMECNEYRNSKQLEAGFCALKKNDSNIELISEWLKFCENSDILTDDLTGNEKPYFKDHRHDQAILTNIILKKNIKTVNISEIYDYVNFNEKVL